MHGGGATGGAGKKKPTVPGRHRVFCRSDLEKLIGNQSTTLLGKNHSNGTGIIICLLARAQHQKNMRKNQKGKGVVRPNEKKGSRWPDCTQAKVLQRESGNEGDSRKNLFQGGSGGEMQKTIGANRQQRRMPTRSEP